MPIRELFHSHFKFNSKSHNPVQKVKDSLDFSEALLLQEPTFATRNPNALQKVQELKKQNPNYLIHEYLNQDWQCFSFQQVIKTLEDIKLSYASPNDLNVHLDNINFVNNIKILLILLNILFLKNSVEITLQIPNLDVIYLFEVKIP